MLIDGKGNVVKHQEQKRKIQVIFYFGASEVNIKVTVNKIEKTVRQ